jgi:hypothetical protein
MTTFYLPFCVLPDWSTGHVAAAIKRSGSFYIWAERGFFIQFSQLLLLFYWLISQIIFYYPGIFIDKNNGGA